MKISCILTFIAILSYINVTSQTLYHETYDWEKPLVDYQDSVNDKVIIKENYAVEYAFDGDYFYEYRLKHVIEYINSDEQIELSNKKYITLYTNNELLSAKVRVIKRDGKIIEMGKDKVLSSSDETTGQISHYFALEGLEKGFIVEYMYTIRKYPQYNGIIRYIQESDSIISYQFHLMSPKHLIFDFAVYNDTNQVVIDTTETEKNHWKLNINQISALNDEPQAPYNKLLKQVWYKLDRNLAKGTKDISSYGDASQNIYRQMFDLGNKKEQQALHKFLSKLVLPENSTTEQKVIAIENYLKSNINLVEDVSSEYGNMGWVLENKTASDIGMTRLMVQSFKKLGVDFQLVLTNDRTQSFFNTKFESYNCLSFYLIYFPELKQFITTENFLFRYPIIPHEYTDNQGLFIKETELGDFKTGIGKVKYIPPLDYNKSANNLDIVVSINPELDTVHLNITRTSTGYYAVYEQGYYSLINQQDKEKMVKEGLHLLMKDLTISSYEVFNGDINQVGKDPYIIQCKALHTEMIEQAGNKFLFKVGDLIGPQVEMYSETQRKLPVWDVYKRCFVRHLVIEIPEGYKVINVSDLALEAHYEKAGKKVLLFESTYSVQENSITIDINEYYDQLYFEVDEYESYRKVVNSAADFNKVVLILEQYNFKK